MLNLAEEVVPCLKEAPICDIGSGRDAAHKENVRSGPVIKSAVCVVGWHCALGMQELGTRETCCGTRNRIKLDY